jgi:glycosyltransferase involved in cell wall biosynthesis
MQVHDRCAQSMEPRVIGVSGGPPFDPQTSSGWAHQVFGEIERLGNLVGAVRGRPALVDWLEKGGAFSFDRRVWRHRFFGSMTRTSALARIISDAVASRRVRELQPEANAILQVTSWFPVDRLSVQPRLLRVLYIDTTAARYLERPDLPFSSRFRPAKQTVAFERSLFGRTDLILTASEWARASVIEHYGQDPGKVVAVGAGADATITHPPTEREWSPPKFLFVGMAWERKGGPFVLDAFAEVRERHPDAELWVAGPRRSQRDGPGVRWFGRIPPSDPAGQQAMHRLFRDATAFVLAPEYDPFPTVFREAMSYGLPCVGPDIGAIPEMLVDGETGFTFKPGDREAIADCMLRLAGDPGLARRMGEAGRTRFEQEFTWSVTVTRMLGSMQERLSAPEEAQRSLPVRDATP